MSTARPPLLILTDVAPYRDGPAGVHGVLAQAASALAEVGSMCGLEPVGLASVADLTVGQLNAGGALALFTIGETPFSPAQQTAISPLRGVGAASVSWASTPPPMPATTGPTTAPSWAAGSPVIPGPSRSRSRW